MRLEELKEFCSIYHHKFIVLGFLNTIIQELTQRGQAHDQSKFDEDEFPHLVAALEDITKYPFGTPEYDAMRLKHQRVFAVHHSKNRHHPEHFANGVEDMTAVDLIEMLVDWKAASMREKDGSIEKSIKLGAEKYNIHPQLIKILENTAKACKM